MQHQFLSKNIHRLFYRCHCFLNQRQKWSDIEVGLPAGAVLIAGLAIALCELGAKHFLPVFFVVVITYS